jgi:IS5 family transposase
MYDNKSEKGGRPNCDVILMFKILILQQWYGLNDLEVERQMADRISFMSFLGFPNPFPDSRTIWLFRERMANTGKEEVVWAENQRERLTGLPRPAIAEMEPGRKKERKAILATSFIKKATSITALSVK